ncbi:putative RNA-directed DNA polymerase [Helianthus annuus]|nr:putative RNA-directed DNA polymerase [Helianthus annuus]KAJ0474880.1 putative RNA-directed DNA polymerase [Helianthus annuus]KAJ0650436.1 putative RNA-directed DNA polymerase [Helianthus annuus]
MGLDNEFVVIKTQILAMNPIPSLGNAYHLVAEDERQRTISGEKTPPTEVTAFKAFVPNKRSNNFNHRQDKTTSKDQKRGDVTKQCTHCGRSGHNRDGCFKIIGYPEWWPGKVKREEGKPRAAHVETDASPVPDLTKEQYQSFLKHFVENDIKEDTKLHTRSLIGAGKCKKGLYRMGMFDGERRALMVTEDIWHKRLGHASEDKLATIEFLKNISLNDLCDSCSKAKHARLPFSNSFIKTNTCFDLVHCDIWGKYHTPSFSGANYFLTIVDDHSRATWVFLLKFKHEASKWLKFFCNMVKTQFEKSVKRIRCDNGGEFTSNKMIEFYEERGILLETTCPHTPQQNGVVERKHRHLLEVARSLWFEANLPKRFWGECILTATYIINRLPSKVIGDKTPFELLFNRKPDYDNMRVFGCLAYFRNTDTEGDKFEERGRPGLFVGYPQEQKVLKFLT